MIYDNYMYFLNLTKFCCKIKFDFVSQTSEKFNLDIRLHRDTPEFDACGIGIRNSMEVLGS